MQLIFCTLNRLFSGKSLIFFLKIFHNEHKKEAENEGTAFKGSSLNYCQRTEGLSKFNYKKANLAYGTFYRYFKDLDEIYYEAIEELLFELAVKLERDLKNIYPAPLRSRNLLTVIDFYKDKITVTYC